MRRQSAPSSETLTVVASGAHCVWPRHAGSSSARALVVATCAQRSTCPQTHVQGETLLATAAVTTAPLWGVAHVHTSSGALGREGEREGEGEGEGEGEQALTVDTEARYGLSPTRQILSSDTPHASALPQAGQPGASG